MQASRTMPAIEQLALFDSCVTLGKLSLLNVPRCLTPDNILDVMDAHGIAEALVHSAEARIISPRRRGNRRLLEDIAGLDRLHPVWVLEPPEKPDPPAARAMVREMLDAGVRAARLMMGVMPPLLWLWGDLCAELEAHRVPCLLDFAPLGEPTTNCVPDALALDNLREICLAYPQLPMILSHASGGLGLSRATIPLMHRADNLLMDITAIVDYWRRVVRELGPHRIVFATGMPFYDPSILVSNVQYDEKLDLPAKKLLCGDNLRRLLEDVR